MNTNENSAHSFTEGSDSGTLKFSNPVTEYPKGTTKEQWEKYELDLKNHEAWVSGRRQYLEAILSTVQNYSIDYARSYFNRLLDETLSMDSPNKPGYYRANND